ncbi:hypothetical protein N7536_010034 [Penicillium majusculum]|uniref:ATP-grasp domain-containing protein n=1 Tax=Penicillium solitum TaxID=60172 RepID=A0A1V6R158_9EURO|nr:uncharacterized protein PENSOL_c021G02937 [Penicillium solitum]KAJ5687415.1 hypothetical protein N7536_010034 [Penicillium majusculum]OQD95184.1 hypothetical protein PENSOL_c021G02937 [Penicillium solitum]
MDPALPIKLDYTLRDLYSDNNEDDLNTVLIYYPLQFGYNHERSSTKFAYGYTLQDGDEKAASSIKMAANMVPQRYAFSAGQMPLVILDCDSTNNHKEANHKTGQIVDKLPAHHVDIHRTFAQLMPDQRPNLTFVTSPESISLDAGAQIAVLLPTDCLSHLPHLVHPETHYEILSKRGLAMSGLPTPPSQVIDTCLIDSGDPILLKQEVARIVNSIGQQQLPFMIKLPQSISGMGTFAIITKAERDRVKNILTAQLGAMLQQLNRSNHHLYPCSLVLQDFITGPVVALSFFVTKKGLPRFIACCEQIFDKQGHWIGGSISYRQQTGLCESFAAIMEKVAAFLHSKGYHGPAGVDIVTDERSGEQLIIDLNVRVTGTFHLGPLMGHFTQRGLFEAAMTMGDSFYSRDEFEKKFADEIRNGSLIVSGWVHGESRHPSHAAITIGARDSHALGEFLERIRAVGLHT